MAQIYGELIRAQLQLSATDLTPTATGLVYFNSTAGLKWYNGSAWKVGVDTDSSQTLSAKTIDNSNSIDAEAIADGSVTNAQFQHLSGASSNIQGQIDNKADAGANSDITSLSGLTTALSISQGGTGATTASGAINSLLPSQSGNLNKFLRTDGTDVEWAPAGGGSGINYMSEFFDSDVSPVTTSVAAISTTNTDYTNFLVSSAGGTLSQDTASAVRGANSYKFVPTASGEFFGLPAFQLAEVDLGKALSIKFDLKNDGAVNDFDVVVCRYNSSGVHQETISVAGTASSGTPASAQLPTGLTSFRGFFITGSDATDYYRLFVRHLTSATDAVYLDTLVVGPEAVMEGAIVTDWESYTPTWTSESSSPSIGNGTLTGSYRQVGDSIEVRVKMIAGSTTTGGTGDWRFSIPNPSSWTVDETKLATPGNQTTQIGYGQWLDASSGDRLSLGVKYNSGQNNYVVAPWQYAVAARSYFIQDYDNIGQSQPVAVGTGDTVFINFSVPITQLSSNTVMASRAVEEYAYNTDLTSTATVTSSGFANGPSGTNISSNWSSPGQTYRRRVRFQTPILPTDLLILEMDAVGNGTFSEGVYNYIAQSSVRYGALLLQVSGSNTDCDVIFGGGGRQPDAASYAGQGTLWSSIASLTKWRVRKVSSGAAVGFPIAPANITLIDSSDNYSGNTKLGLMQYVAGTAYNGGNIPDVSGANFTKTRGVFIPYQMADGTWRLKFSFRGVFAGAGNNNYWQLALSGVTSKNISSFNQQVAVTSESGINSPYGAYILAGTGFVSVVWATVLSYNGSWSLSGDIELDSKPTWAY